MGNAAVAAKRAAYPAYQPSGMEWVGDVPKHWQIRRLKYTASINDEALPETTDPDYEFNYVDIGSVDASKGIVATETYRFEDAPSRARRIVREGDTIVSTVRTYLRAIAAICEPAENLIVSTGFAIVRPRSLDPGFLSYVLRSPFFVETVVSRSTGVSYPAINAPEVGNIGIILPPPDEQRAIAAFLDRETARIDALIEKKRRQIELLQEKRSALISHAVTKGLNPQAPMKDSGIEWLGQIPAHWKIARLGYYARVFNGATPSRNRPEYWFEGKVPWLSSGKVNEDVIKEPSEWITDLARLECGLRMVPAGAVVMGIVGQGRTRGTSALMGCNAAINQNMAAIVSASGLRGEFLYFVLQHMYGPIREYGRGANQAALNCEQVAELRIPLPPVDEQRWITNGLQLETGKAHAMADRIRDSIAVLQEHRSALISAAVTGKIDVRTEGAEYGIRNKVKAV